MDVNTENGVMHYTLSSAWPGDGWYRSLVQTLAHKSSQLKVKHTGVTGQPQQVSIFLQGRPLFLLHFSRFDSKSSRTRPKAKIAIIVDDLGRDLHALRGLLAIDLNLTMAVMPEEPHTGESAELAYRAGHEVLVHMPMEPDSYPQNNPGPGALLLGQDRAEIKNRVSAMFAKVPHAVGGNNHMGSRFTQYTEGMQAVFEVMKEGGWFLLTAEQAPDQSLYPRRVGRRWILSAVMSFLTIIGMWMLLPGNCVKL